MFKPYCSISFEWIRFSWLLLLEPYSINSRYFYFPLKCIMTFKLDLIETVSIWEIFKFHKDVHTEKFVFYMRPNSPSVACALFILQELQLWKLVVWHSDMAGCSLTKIDYCFLIKNCSLKYSFSNIITSTCK